MIYSDLNDNQRRRFNRLDVCPICHQKIDVNENFVLIKKRNRRYKVYTFYHERCLFDESKKETKIEQVST